VGRLNRPQVGAKGEGDGSLVTGKQAVPNPDHWPHYPLGVSQ